MTGTEESPVVKTGEKEGGERMTGSQKTGRNPGVDLMIGLRLIVLLLVLIAAVQLYFTIQGVIALWVADQFIPLVNAIYYIVVIIGGIWLLWRVLSKQ